MKRRGFLKGLGAIAASAAVIIPAEIKAVAEKKELTDIEKATKVDCDFNSPFLYVEAREDIKQGDIVAFCDITPTNPYRVSKKKNNLGYTKACGLATTDVKQGNWFFIQTVGHCILPKTK